MPLAAITTGSYGDPNVVLTTATSPAAPVISPSSGLLTYVAIAAGLYWAYRRGWLKNLESKLSRAAAGTTTTTQGVN